MTRFDPRRRSRLILLVALATSACASIPDLGALPVSRAPALADQASKLAGDASAWPAEGWWQRYQDPQLTGLIEAALAGSPDLDVAAARVRAAGGFAQQAGAALKPTIEGMANASTVRLSKNNGIPAAIVPDGWNDTGTVGIGMSIDLDLWGKNRAALRAAKRELDAARFDAAEAQLTLTTAIAGTYAELAALYAQRDSLTAALEVRSETLALVDQRVTRGLDTEMALRQASARLAQTRSQLSATDEAITLTKHALAALIGAGPDRADTIARPMPAALHAQGLPDTAAVDLISRRPDIAAARARVEAASERIAVAKAGFYPNVRLSALIGLQAFGLDNVFKGDSAFGAVGPAISLPIFQGGALQGQYRGRRAQYDEAVALYDRQIIGALRQTADALTSQQMLSARLADQRRALTDFEAANRLARLRYGQGLANYLDVLATEEGVLDARLGVARLETRAFALDIALVRALGGGFQA